MRRVLQILLFMSLLCAACTRETLPPGVVATVNGEGITLHELQAADAAYGDPMSMEEDAVLAIEDLRSRYGVALSGLIVEKLMLQELGARRLALSEADVRRVEDGIRADYAQGEFEKMLEDELVDLADWRTQLKIRLGKRLFQEKVLKPMVVVSDEEIAKYYAANEKTFVTPSKIDFLVVSGGEAEKMQRVRAEFPTVPERLADVDLRHLVMNVDRLPDAWLKEMTQAGMDVAGPLVEEDGRYRFLVQKDRIAARRLSLEDAEPMIRELFVEKRCGEAFGRWLESTLPSAKIKVVPELLPFDGAKDGRS